MRSSERRGSRVGATCAVGGVCWVLALPACFGSSDSGSAPDGGTDDMDASADATPPDAGATPIDATTTPVDASPIDATSADASPLDVSNPDAASAPVGPGIYVTDYATNSVLVFALDASGNVAPTRTISGSSTGMSGPIGIGVDSQGSVYVANREGASVTVYPALADGNVAPVRTLTAQGMSAPEGIAVAPGDDVFVSTCPTCGGNEEGNIGIYHFPSQSSQTDRILGGASNANTGLTVPGALALDDSQDLVVGNSFGGTIEFFANAANGDVAPTSVFQPSTSNLQSIAYDDGTIFVTDPSAGVEQYVATDAGVVMPASTIPASAFPITYPAGMAIDTNATPPVLYVVDFSANAIYVAQTAGTPPNLTVASVTTIAGDATTLNMPLGIAIVR